MNCYKSVNTRMNTVDFEGDTNTDLTKEMKCMTEGVFVRKKIHNVRCNDRKL